MPDTENPPPVTTTMFDVLIVGAGLSGIGAAVHLQRHCPDRRFAILEAREASGGTWDLFRYPGVRSDSDMYTLGYDFKAWTGAKAIADGPAILDYIRDTAREHGLEPHIRYQHRLVRADWSSADACWTVQLLQGPAQQPVQMRCQFLLMCSGYYRYDQGHTPDFPGAANFTGRIVHPQHWPADLDSRGKQVVVIGSGATAVTLVPALVQAGAQVTMLQRSPTYMVARPGVDALASWCNRYLPARLAYGLTRWKNVLLGMAFYKLARRYPQGVARAFIGAVKKQVGPALDVAQHFTPRYKPWDQRVCLVPDGDLFKNLRDGQASVVTAPIECFTPTGIRLQGGQTLPADVIITATGLELQMLGGAQLTVDGQPVVPHRCLGYKGMMLSGVPNLVNFFGYTNASWTLKSDLTARYACRLLNHLRQQGQRSCTPVLRDPTLPTAPWVDFSSGYIQRALDRFPQQGQQAPWRLHQNYALDLLSLRFGRLQDGVLVFA